MADIGLDDMFDTVPKTGGYFSDMTKTPDETVNELQGAHDKDALGEEVQVNKQVKTKSVDADIIQESEDRADIDYKEKYEAAQKSYDELRKLQGKQTTELGQLREDYDKTLETFNNTFDMIDDKPVLKPEILDKFPGMTKKEKEEATDEFTALLEKDDVKGAVESLAAKIADQKIAEQKKEVEELKAWRKEQEENKSWREIETNLKYQISELEKDNFFVENKAGVLEVMSSAPELFEYVENPVAVAYDIFKGRNLKAKPQAETFMGETGKTQSPSSVIDPWEDYKKGIRDAGDVDILSTLI